MTGTPPVEFDIQPDCAGPADAWLRPRLQMRLRPSDVPIRTTRAKLGGQPVWLDQPTWPVSCGLGIPMMFVGQFPIPGEQALLAYLFATDDPGAAAETYDAEGGENALLVQPGGRVPAFVATTDRVAGPSLWRHGVTWEEHIPVELAVDLVPFDPASEAVLDAEIARQDFERSGLPPQLRDATDIHIIPPYSYMGGRVHQWQPDLRNILGNWRFFFQLDGSEGWEPDEPYALNFGGGTGYAFLSPDLREGRFFWDR